MTSDPPASSAAQARRDREAEALRENLRKRKEQQRARANSTKDVDKAHAGDDPSTDDQATSPDPASRPSGA